MFWGGVVIFVKILAGFSIWSRREVGWRRKQRTFPTIHFCQDFVLGLLPSVDVGRLRRASSQSKRSGVLRDTGKSHTRQGEIRSCGDEVGKTLGIFLWSLCWNLDLIIRANRATDKALYHKFEIPSIITLFIYSSLKLFVDNTASERFRSETILCVRLCPLMLVL